MLLVQILTVLLFSSMALIILRALKGETLADRILAMNSFGTKTVLAIILISLLKKDSNYIDVALVYTLINFISVIAFLKFFSQETKV